MNEYQKRINNRRNYKTSRRRETGQKFDMLDLNSNKTSDRKCSLDTVIFGCSFSPEVTYHVYPWYSLHLGIKGTLLQLCSHSGLTIIYIYIYVRKTQIYFSFIQMYYVKNPYFCMDPYICTYF